MKKILISVLTILLMLSVVNVMGYNTGVKGKTGSPSEGNCTSCHSDFGLNTGSGSITVTSNIPGWTYTAGQTYTITITVGQVGAVDFGWDLEALKSDGSSGGKMMVSDAGRSQIGYQTVSGKSRANFYHKLGGGTSNDITTISFNWLAPTADSGNVTLYFTGLAADGSGDEFGDYVYSGSQIILKPAASIPLVLNCATNQTVGSCQTQAAINSAYATWLSTATISGGCGAALTNNSAGAPLACGGSSTVTWTATSTCGATQTCSATFTVNSAAPVSINCVGNQTTNACQTQAAVNAAFYLWLTNVTVTGGCNTVLTNDAVTPPLACGGSALVTWTATSDCGAPVTCSATFAVSTSTPVAITCASNHTENACQTQAAIDAAFNTWLATATVSGGCNAVLTNDATTAPLACGGSTLVTWTATSDCGTPVTCSATFAVNASTPVLINCANNQTENACQTQTAINAAFNTWLATATVSGGCNAVLTNDATNAPSACGGSTLVTWTATSDCGAPVTCSATFAVTASTPVVITCATNQTENACQTQTAINAAFNTWLATATVSGGCNAVLTNDATNAPSACGGSTLVTWTATSDCGAPVTCSATFAVNASTPVVLNCIGNQSLPAGNTQSTVDAAYAIWLSSTNFTGGCNGVLTNNSTGGPLASGGSVNVIFTVTSDCEAAVTCNATFTVAAPAPEITVNPIKITGFTAPVNGYSAAQTFTFSASNLTADVKLVAPPEFQISLTGVNGTYKTKIFVAKDLNNSVPVTTVYVRFHPYAQGDASAYVKLFSNNVPLNKVKVRGNATVIRLAEPTLAATEMDVVLTPNPATDNLNLSITNIEQNATVTLFDVTGNKMQSMAGIPVGSLSIDISSLPAGLYFCRIESGSSVITKKFVKE